MNYLLLLLMRVDLIAMENTHQGTLIFVYSSRGGIGKPETRDQVVIREFRDFATLLDTMLGDSAVIPNLLIIDVQSNGYVISQLIRILYLQQVKCDVLLFAPEHAITEFEECDIVVSSWSQIQDYLEATTATTMDFGGITRLALCDYALTEIVTPRLIDIWQKKEETIPLALK